MSLNFTAVTPHPPIIIPEVGGADTQKCQQTVLAMEKLSAQLAEINPDTIIIISPHALIHPDRFAVYGSPKFYGDMGQFGASEVGFQYNNDLVLASAIVKKAQQNNLNAFLFGDSDSDYFELDHGIMVPMYYLGKNLSKDVKVIPIAFSLLGKSEHFAFGQVIKEVAISPAFADDKIALIASGDLSHRLTQGAPAGYAQAGQEFDETLLRLIKENKVDEILQLDENFIEDAGECGYRSILILLGALDKLKYQPKILSYEGPFGVGYLVANFEIKT